MKDDGKRGKLVLEPYSQNFHSDLCESAQFVADSLQLRRSSRYPGATFDSRRVFWNQCLFGVEFGCATGVVSRCGTWSFRKLGMIPEFVEEVGAARCWNQSGRRQALVVNATELLHQLGKSYG